MSTLFLVDGNHTTARSFFIPQFQAFSNSEGFKTGVIFGFLQIIKGLSRNWDPDEMVVLWDVGKSEYRLAHYSDYKKDRVEGMDNTYYEQIQQLYDLLHVLGIVQLGINGVEADDLFGLITCNHYPLREKYDKIIMVSSDHDFRQLIVGNSVIQYDPIRKKLFDEVALEKEKGIKPNQVVDYKALIGDISDSIPGIHGIGPGGAKKLLNKYGSIGQFDLEELKKKKTTQRIADEWDKLQLWRTIIQIFRDKDMLAGTQRQEYSEWCHWMINHRDTLKTQKDKVEDYFKKFDFKWATKVESFLMDLGKVIRR